MSARSSRVSPSNEVLADRARQVAESHPPRTPGRRAAAWVYIALTTTGSLSAALRALADCPDPVVRRDATSLARQLAEPDNADTRRTTGS